MQCVNCIFFHQVPSCDPHIQFFRSLKHITSGFYKSLDLLLSSTFLDPEFFLEMHGLGFDGLDLPISAELGTFCKRDSFATF